MKYKNKIADMNTILLIIIAGILAFLIVFLLLFHSYLEGKVKPQESDINEPNENKPSENKPSKEIKINIESIIAKIKEEHPNIISEEENDEYMFFTYKETNKVLKNIILNKKTGNLTTFLDSIKKEEFNLKEIELLKLKYPEMIVTGITKTKGYKSYLVKSDRVEIFYYDYTYLYPINEEISLTIDYKEIKDILEFIPTLNKELTNEDGYDYKNTKKAIAITFDDGPSGKYNPLILEELRKNKAHATFFMLGEMMNSCKGCVANTYKSGNEIGSHTYNHINIKNKDTKTIMDNLNKTNNLYNSITNDNIKLLRPPYGSYSKANLDNISYTFILWNLDTEDWRYRNKEHIITYIKKNVSDGSIILMHELYESSYQALKEILPWLYANGYQVVSVSELAKLKNKTLASGVAYNSLR